MIAAGSSLAVWCLAPGLCLCWEIWRVCSCERLWHACGGAPVRGSGAEVLVCAGGVDRPLWLGLVQAGYGMGVPVLMAHRSSGLPASSTLARQHTTLMFVCRLLGTLWVLRTLVAAAARVRWMGWY